MDAAVRFLDGARPGLRRAVVSFPFQDRRSGHLGLCSGTGPGDVVSVRLTLDSGAVGGPPLSLRGQGMAFGSGGAPGGERGLLAELDVAPGGGGTLAEPG